VLGLPALLRHRDFLSSLFFSLEIGEEANGEDLAKAQSNPQIVLEAERFCLDTQFFSSLAPIPPQKDVMRTYRLLVACAPIFYYSLCPCTDGRAINVARHRSSVFQLFCVKAQIAAASRYILLHPYPISVRFQLANSFPHASQPGAERQRRHKVSLKK
jgi:hypothetical protein